MNALRVTGDTLCATPALRADLALATQLLEGATVILFTVVICARSLNARTATSAAETGGAQCPICAPATPGLLQITALMAAASLVIGAPNAIPV